MIVELLALKAAVFNSAVEIRSSELKRLNGFSWRTEEIFRVR